MRVRELGPGRVEISFPDVQGIPDNFEMLKFNIEQILPAHVEAEYMVRYLSWAELEAKGWTFGDLSAMSWYQMEKTE